MATVICGDGVGSSQPSNAVHDSNRFQFAWVGVGLVASLARPGGNATGVHQLNTALGAKQLGLLRELVPGAARVGLLVNPENRNAAETMIREVTLAAS